MGCGLFPSLASFSLVSQTLLAPSAGNLEVQAVQDLSSPARTWISLIESSFLSKNMNSFLVKLALNLEYR